MPLKINGQVDLVCDDCRATDFVGIAFTLPDFSTLLRKIASLGWVVLGADGTVRCPACNGMSQEDVDASAFDLKLRG